MKSLSKLFGLALLAAAVPFATANASIWTYHADLSAANEVLSKPSSATGLADVTLDDVTMMLTISMSFTGLTAPAAAGHIHCCASLGTNAAVRVPFTSFPATMAGTYANTFLLAAVLPGSPTLSFADFLSALNNGLAYVNLHTVNNPVGEVRGQLIRVPEPASLALFGLGIAALGWATRKRAATRV